MDTELIRLCHSLLSVSSHSVEDPLYTMNLNEIESLHLVQDLPVIEREKWDPIAFGQVLTPQSIMSIITFAYRFPIIYKNIISISNIRPGL